MINSFRGKYAFLSNMYEAPIIRTVRNFETGEKRDIVLTCAEALFQGAKTFVYSEQIKFDEVDGKTAKRIGRTVTLRPHWNDIRVNIMRKVIHTKFQNKELADMLVATGNEELVEGNTWNDRFWGVCNGEGENWLGKILMEERNAINIERMLTEYDAWCDKNGLDKHGAYYDKWLESKGSGDGSECKGHPRHEEFAFIDEMSLDELKAYIWELDHDDCSA